MKTYREDNKGKYTPVEMLKGSSEAYRRLTNVNPKKEKQEIMLLNI
jgi:hypothetical protein